MNLSSTLEIYAARKLHKRLVFHGMQISVENKKGSVRRGVDDGGHKWATKMRCDYGYIRKTVGADGEHVDCFIGPESSGRSVFVIRTNRAPKFTAYDEDKVFLGFRTAAEAKACFQQHYDNPKFFRGVDTLTVAEFKNKYLHGAEKPEKLDGEELAATLGMAYIEPRLIFHPPSLKNTEAVPVDDPQEKNNKFLDVSKRRSAETIGFRDRLTKKKGSDSKYMGIRTTQVSGFPTGTVGGFG